MSIFNRRGDKSGIRKKVKRLKKSAIVARSKYKIPIIRFMSIAMVGVLVIGGGFMGISSFIPEERSINLEESAVMAPVNSLLSQSTTESAVTTKQAKVLEDQGKTSDSKERFGDVNNTGMAIDSKAAVLMDAASGTVLFSQNGDDRLPPASVTKVMTMLLAMEAIDTGQVTYADTVTVSERAASMGGSQMYMEPGETHTLEELMKGISMVSANDACVAFKKEQIWENWLYC